MAVAGPGVYDKGSLFGCDKDWYHGDLTRVEAEQALGASGCDCFLVRQSRATLVLSLIHHGQVHHVKINHGPGWYELSCNSSQYSFPELEELVSHYSSEPIAINEGLKLTLGVACENSANPSHAQDLPFYETIKDIYETGEPSDLLGHHWYHGCITEDQANAALRTGNRNMFLVRRSSRDLILSKTINGWTSHDTIHRTLEGYRLEGKAEVFHSIPDMIRHYQQFPVNDSNQQVLGVGAHKRLSTELKRRSSKIVFTKEESLLRVRWRRCADLPAGVSTPHVVRMGDSVYVGGGLRRTQGHTIFRYSLDEDAWMPLPHCPTYQHALTQLDGELIALGGNIRLGKPTNLVYTFREGTWKELLPSMPTARNLLSASSHADRVIIAAGGTTCTKSNGECTATDIVEVYVKSLQWYNTKRLPFPTSGCSLTVLNNRCYVLGGISLPGNSCTTLFASVSSLLEYAVPAGGEYSPPQAVLTWKKLQGRHPLICSSLVEVGEGERLAAVGGSLELKLRCGTKFVGSYDFAADVWVECKGAELPLPLYRPGVVKLEGNKMMVVGGQLKMQHFSNAVFLGEY